MLNEIRPNKHKLIQTSLLLQDINELFPIEEVLNDYHS